MGGGGDGTMPGMGGGISPSGFIIPLSSLVSDPLLLKSGPEIFFLIISAGSCCCSPKDTPKKCCLIGLPPPAAPGDPHLQGD